MALVVRAAISEAGAILYVATFALIAEGTSGQYILFPGLGALSYDIFKRPDGTWARAPFMLVLTPVATAIVGTPASRHFTYGPASMISLVVAVILVIRLLRSPVAPALSTGILPLTLGVSSSRYPLSLLVGVAALAGVAIIRLRLDPHPRPPAIRDRVEEMIGEPPADYSWIPFFLLFLALALAAVSLTGWRFLLFPPLVVIAFEMFAHPAICPWAERPCVLPLACALSAAGATTAVDFLGPGALAAVCSMAVGAITLRSLKFNAPPVMAVALLPFVIAEPNYRLPIAIGGGATLLAATFLLWRWMLRRRA